MVKSRHWENRHFKDISIQFLYGEPVEFTLDDTSIWQTIDFMGIGNDIITNYVNISVISVYDEAYGGFSELKVFGHASGMCYNNNVIKQYLSYSYFRN